MATARTLNPVAVAKYLNSNTSPDDKIAVLGSEPEIFFLSHRRSASGYVCLYSLTEPQPLAPQMQKNSLTEGPGRPQIRRLCKHFLPPGIPFVLPGGCNPNRSIPFPHGGTIIPQLPAFHRRGKNLR